MMVVKTAKNSLTNGSRSAVDFAKKKIQQDLLTEEKYQARDSLNQRKALIAEQYIENSFTYSVLENVDKVKEVKKIVSDLMEHIDLVNTYNANIDYLRNSCDKLEEDASEFASELIMGRITSLAEQIDDLIIKDSTMALSEEYGDDNPSLVLKMYSALRTEQIKTLTEESEDGEMDDLSPEGEAVQEELILQSLKNVRTSLLIENMNIVFKKGTHSNDIAPIFESYMRLV